ncbi:hypothetical protein SDC9_101416 [bioreactor metagenome]|uniref:Uncharacterized protein n=1 Tax=bioreactor metagenome TaxID=1076179 RepID=A0A645ANL7_9ZZZZ
MRFASEPEEHHIHGTPVCHGVLDSGAWPEESGANRVYLVFLDVCVERVNGEDRAFTGTWEGEIIHAGWIV